MLKRLDGKPIWFGNLMGLSKNRMQSVIMCTFFEAQLYLARIFTKQNCASKWLNV